MRTSCIAIMAALAGPLSTGAAAQEAGTPDAAGAAPDIAQAQNDWYVSGEARIEELLAVRPNTNTARNVILFTADGMGPSTGYAIRIFEGQQLGGYGDDHVLSWEAFPNVALVRTYTTNGQTPDSAPTAAAMNSGVKQRNDVINVPEAVVVDDCEAALDPANHLTLFSEIATAMGKSVGIVSTARLTHATPAAVYSRSADRDWENDSFIPEGCAQLDIAAQLAAQMDAGVIDLALGGGRENFLPAEATGDEGSPGARTDGRNLIEEMQALGAQYAWNDETFAALPVTGDAPLLGLFEDSHMLYEHDRIGEPSLAEMTELAINTLSQNPNGYFVSIEGGRVDHANHAGNFHRVVTDGVAFAEAVAKAVEMTSEEDTLIIVTADHSHTLNFNGYCGRGSPITGLCMEVDPNGQAHTGVPALADDGKPYTTAGYLNGAGSILVPESEVDEDDATPLPVFSGSRPDLTQEEATDPDYLQQALIPLGSETHSGEDVYAYASGPFAHLVTGSIEQNVLFHIMHHAATAGAAMDITPDSGAAGAATPAATGSGTGESSTEAAVNDAAEDAADGLPEEATAEPLEDAAEESADPTNVPEAVATDDDQAGTGPAATGESSAEAAINDAAEDAADGLPEAATAEPLEEAAEESAEGADQATGDTNGTVEDATP